MKHFEGIISESGASAYLLVTEVELGEILFNLFEDIMHGWAENRGSLCFPRSEGRDFSWAAMSDVKSILLPIFPSYGQVASGFWLTIMLSSYG